MTITSTPTPTISTAARELEDRASRVVTLIQQCIDIIKAVPEFQSIPPAELWSAVKDTSQNNSNTQNDKAAISISKIESVNLFQRLQETGLADQVRALCDYGRNNHCHHGSIEQTNNQTNNPRRQLVERIFQPLAQALSDCYAQLDELTTMTTTKLPPINTTTTRRPQTSKVPPPPPPWGMLSLQNYTDIGAFLELFVCTSILPQLESNILLRVQDRARYCMPKSLAGRLVKPSLLWGCLQSSHERPPAENYTTITRLQIIQELESTVTALGQLLLLDRFRPMLLPRHLSDLYAAIFQAQECRRKMTQHGKSSTALSPISPPTSTPNYGAIQALLLPPLSSLTKNHNNKGSINSQEQSVSPPNKSTTLRRLVPVDVALQAQSLQTLLLQGTKAPLWLRQDVAQRLSDMATQHLSVMIQVFVHAAPPKDKTAASLRLARTLCLASKSTTTTTTTTTTNDATRNSTDYYDLLCEQILQVLDQIIIVRDDNHPKAGLSPKELLEIHTLWAILDQMPASEMQRRMLRLWGRHLLLLVNNNGTNDTTTAIHKSVKHMALLLSSKPPLFPATKVAQVFFMPMEINVNHDTLPLLQSSSTPSLSGTKSTTLLGQLLRLCSLNTSVLKSNVRDDAVLALRLIIDLILSSRFSCIDNATVASNARSECTPSHHDVNQVQVEIAAMMLVYAAAPSQWDLSGKTYKLMSTTATTTTTTTTTTKSESMLPPLLDSVTIEQQQGDDIAVCTPDLVLAVERRVKVVVEDILAPLHPTVGGVNDRKECNEERDRESPTNDKHAGANLPATLFHLVLLLYFSSLHHQSRYNNENGLTMTHQNNIPSIFRQSSAKASNTDDLFQLVVMCCLPLLCEHCPTESLLQSSQNDDGMGIFQMMRLVFSRASNFFAAEKILSEHNNKEHTPDGPRLDATSYNDEATDSTIIQHHLFDHSGRYLSRVLVGASSTTDQNYSTVAPATGTVPFSGVDGGNVEMLLSVTSLLLSLLIAIMELGTKARRSYREEAFLESLVLLLRPLAEACDTPWIDALAKNQGNDPSNCRALSTAYAEVAEMAGHAMALLVAHKAPSSPESDGASNTHSSAQETVEDVLRQAEKDLSSVQPPLRARGVVSLQHFLRGNVFQKMLSEEVIPAPKAPLIIEISDTDEKEQEQSLLEYAIERVLHLAIGALADEESYVFLAAIQTIVGTSDLCPRIVLPRLSLAVATGKLRAQGSRGNTGTALLPGQQVKLAEALIFCIRRRASVEEYVEIVLDVMIFGNHDDGRQNTNVNHLQSDFEKVMQIHNETQKYFLRGRTDEERDDEDLEEIAEKQKIRINTGGPIFSGEESDLVTAGRIAVISELLPAAHPSALATYCHVLVQIAIQTLRLDASRPVRRSAALLARNLYRSVVREQVELFEMLTSSHQISEVCTDLAFTSALVSSGDEDKLEVCLERCVAAADLQDISKSKHRLFDSATVARCQEALNARQEACDGGVLGVARVIAEAKMKDSRLPATSIVSELLQAKQQDVADNLQMLNNLRIDADTLELGSSPR